MKHAGKLISAIFVAVSLVSVVGCASGPQKEGTGEYIDDTVKTPEDVTRLTSLPTLGVISRIEGNNYAEKLVTVRQPLSRRRAGHVGVPGGSPSPSAASSGEIQSRIPSSVP